MNRALLMIAALSLLTACNSTTPIRDPNNNEATRAASVNVQLGAGYMREGKNELALTKLKRALAEDPKLPSAHYVIAILYERLGMLDKADTHYQRAVSLAPDDPEARNNYGTFLCGQNRLKDAEAQFLAAVKNPLYKTPEFAYTNAGICALRIPDEAKAEGYFHRAIEVNPQFGDALYQLALLNFNRQRYLPARAYLQRHLEVSPHSAAALWLGVRVERALGDKRAAADYAKLLKTNFPNSRETELLLNPGSHGQPAGQ